jgi:hypothetical protein
VTRAAIACAVLAMLAIAACKRRQDSSSPPASSKSKAPPAKPLVPRDTPNQCQPHGAHTCYGDAVVECNANGSIGPTVQACKAGCRSGACIDSCATQGAELVYVVDNERDLLSFDPTRLDGEPLHVIAKLACPGTDSHPFSMAVDRGGIAWVLYQDGQLYRVSIVDGHCAAAPMSNAGGPALFGMGFTHQGSGSDDEALYTVHDGAGAFGVLDTASEPAVWTTRGTTRTSSKPDMSPDLTGTRDGELFGYFPSSSGPSEIQQLDLATGRPTGQELVVPSTGGHANAWAFAHWGGVFYVFATYDHKSSIYAVHRKTGTASVVRDRIPYEITGAGVSTCAPELEAQ